MFETLSNRLASVRFVRSLLIGRLIHSHAVSQEQEKVRLRVLGMMLTFVTIGRAAVGLLMASLI